MFTRRRYLKVGVACGLTLVLAVLWMLFRKEAPVQDADLVPVTRTVKDEDNGYLILKGSLESVSLGVDEVDAISKLDVRTNWNEALVTKLLSRSENLRKAWSVAAQKPVFITPTKDSPWDMDKMRPMFDIALYKALESEELFKNGKETEAFAVAMENIKIGCQIQNNANSEMRYVLGFAIKRIGLRLIREHTAHTDLSNQTLKRLSDALAEHEANLTSITNALESEYHLFKQRVDEMKDSKKIGVRDYLSSLFTLRTEKTKALYASRIRRCLAELNSHGRKMSFPGAPMDSKMDLIKLYLAGNATGTTLVDLSARSAERLILNKCQENNQLNATRIMLALRCFQNDHGKLPESLIDLVPDYLKTVPEDDYDGKPFHYSREKKLLYSVGENFKDDGGVERDAKGERLDDVYPIQF